MFEGGSLGPSIWAVSDGRAGNASQVRSIVQALGDPRRWMKLAHIAGEAHRDAPMTLSPQKPWTLFPSAVWMNPKGALSDAEQEMLRAPWPTIWIGAGRRTAPYSAAVRKWSKGKTYVVHILDPKMSPRKFDLIVTPVHDRVADKRILATVGSPTFFSQDDQEEAAYQFASLADEQGRSAVVILGGDSKAYTFKSSDAEKLLEQLEGLAATGWRLRITTSRRTPDDVAQQFRRFANEVRADFWAGSDDGPNPYLAWLLFSDAAIVTADSANMLSDAAYHGLPVHIVRLSGGSPKFASFHKSLIDRGCARWFFGELETWSYSPLREADRVADRIIEDVLKRHPQPPMADIESATTTAAPAWL